MQIRNVISTVFLMAIVSSVRGESPATDATLLDLFPKTTFASTAPGESDFSSQFTPSAGPWFKGLDERKVFKAAMKHTQSDADSFELRVGVGGQIYSLAGPFGESLPPSWRGAELSSPWNDEVWQFVAVCSRYNKLRTSIDWLQEALPYEAGYFVHNSGCYIPENDLGLTTLYCPLLASNYDAATRSYQQLNWGLVPQFQTINRSPILYYLQVRDVGEGVIELTWVVHNFSAREDIVFDYLNAPWGGTRISQLPHYYMTNPDGSLRAPDQSDSGIKVRDTGGFILACAEETDDSPSLAMVYGRDKHLEKEKALKKKGFPYTQNDPSRFRTWLAGGPNAERFAKTKPENEHRNYRVSVVIPKFNLAPQTTIWYRSYLIVNQKSRTLELARELIDHVDYGLLQFEAKDTPLVEIKTAKGQKICALYSQPVKGTYPVFKIRHKKTGKMALTTDPYLFTPQKKLDLDVPENDKNYDYYSQTVGYTLDGQTEYLGLVGYGYKEDPELPGWNRLSTLMNAKHVIPSTPYHFDVWVNTK
jgi:hypothetical protein